MKSIVFWSAIVLFNYFFLHVIDKQAVSQFFPFVVPVGWNQTSTSRKRFAERGLGIDRFTAGIDHTIADGQIFRPRRDQAPASPGWNDLLASRLANDTDDGLCWRDVVAWLNLDRSGNAEQRRRRFTGRVKSESAAHDYSRIPMPRCIRYMQPENSTTTNMSSIV